MQRTHLKLTCSLRDECGSINLHLMVAMLRLGNKYGCDRFRAQALSQLHRAFPNSYYQCKNRNSGSGWDADSMLALVEDNEFYLLEIALELGIQTVLPFAFFTCLDSHTVVRAYI